MRIGIIGSTGHTNYVLEGMPELSDVEIVGVAPGSSGESVADLHEAIEAHAPEATRYSDHEALLSTDLDLVVVACHFGDLADRTRAALERDCHVYTEKPVATTLEDLERVRETYAASEGELAAMFGLRYDPAFMTAHERVQGGDVGEVRLVNARKSYVLGDRGEPFLSRETYGGTIPWVGIHAIDWIHWFSDLPARSVRARHSRRANRGHGDLEATGVIDLELDGEVFATASLDYLRPGGAPTHGDDRVRVVGTEGVIEVRNGETYLIDGDAAGERRLPQSPGTNPFVDFVAGIRGESKPRVTAEGSFRATETSLHARNAADADEITRL
jgi:predicted dehydrogenase